MQARVKGGFVLQSIQVLLLDACVQSITTGGVTQGIMQSFGLIN